MDRIHQFPGGASVKVAVNLDLQISSSVSACNSMMGGHISQFLLPYFTFSFVHSFIAIADIKKGAMGSAL
jgi:hypothetical protein